MEVDIAHLILYIGGSQDEETLEELSSRAASRLTNVSRMSGSMMMSSRVATAIGDKQPSTGGVPGTHAYTLG